MKSLTDKARGCTEAVITAYVGEEDGEGLPNGRGRLLFADGGVYEGDWRKGKQHGRGLYLWTCGDRYAGGWVDGQPEGDCIHTFADGGRFEGRMKGGVCEGVGHMRYPSGDRFDGYYVCARKDFGVYTYASGESKVCRFSPDGSGSVEKGAGAKWSADRRVAWPLLDGEQEGGSTISLEEASRRASAIGLPSCAPPILDGVQLTWLKTSGMALLGLGRHSPSATTITKIQ